METSKSRQAPHDQQTDHKKYELMVIINPDIGENATQKRLAEIRKLITSQNGEMFFEDIWGVRDMAYSIKKHDRGYYAVFDFLLLPEMLKEIDATLTLEPEVLRHMIVTLPFKYEVKSYAVKEEENAEPAKTEEKPKPKTAKSEEKKEMTEKKVEVSEKKVKSENNEKVKKDSKQTEDTSLEEVDAKLKSIIDNPDINF